MQRGQNSGHTRYDSHEERRGEFNSGRGRPNTNEGERYEGQRAFRGRGGQRRGTNARTSLVETGRTVDTIALILSRKQVTLAIVVDETTTGTDMLSMDHRRTSMSMNRVLRSVVFPVHEHRW